MRNFTKYIVLSVFSITGNKVFSQTVIGSTTLDASAVLTLDVNSITPKKGFLLPRVNLQSNTDQITISTPATGLLVYNKTAAGSGTTSIDANRIFSWVPTKWNSFSSLAETRALKVPVNYATSSKTQQVFSSSDLTSLNASPANVVAINWASSDVIVDNPNDVTFTGTNQFKILTTSNYLIKGMVNLRITQTNSATGNPTYVVLLLQNSADNGGTWSDIVSSALPYEDYAANRVQTVIFPEVVHSLSQNNLLRLVVSRPNLAGVDTYNTSAVTTGVIVANAGIDITKSFRLTRLQE